MSPGQRERERECASTESYRFESYNWLPNPSQKQPGETQRSRKRKLRRRALFSSIMPSAALLLPQPSFAPTELPAALEEVLHVQLYKITHELGSSQAYVFVCMCLIYGPCSSVAVPSTNLVEVNGAVSDIHQADLYHIC